MKEPIEENSQGRDRRTEPRTVFSEDHYSSVEFSIGGLEPAYIFKVRDISPSGFGILVHSKSAILDHMKVGDILTITYNKPGESEPAEQHRTQIRHITKDDERYKGHVFVGLYILREQDYHA